MTFSHWFEQLCAGDSPYIFDLNYYWNYRPNLIKSLLINLPFFAAKTLIGTTISRMKRILYKPKETNSVSSRVNEATTSTIERLQGGAAATTKGGQATTKRMTFPLHQCWSWIE